MNRIVAPSANIWPHMDAEDEIDRMDTVSAFALSTAMLSIVAGCVALLSMAIAPHVSLGPVSWAQADLQHQDLQTGSIASLGSMTMVHPELLVTHAAATDLDVLRTRLESPLTSCAAM